MNKYWKRIGWMVVPAVLAVVVSVSAEESLVATAPDETAVKWFECTGYPKGCEAAWLWGDAEKAQSGFYVRAPKGYVFPRHLHTSPERILVLRGRISGSVDGSSETMVTPGMYWAFAGKAVHTAKCEDACLMYITYDTPYDVTFR